MILRQSHSHPAFKWEQNLEELKKQIIYHVLLDAT